MNLDTLLSFSGWKLIQTPALFNQAEITTELFIEMPEEWFLLLWLSPIFYRRRGLFGREFLHCPTIYSDGKRLSHSIVLLRNNSCHLRYHFIFWGWTPRVLSMGTLFYIIIIIIYLFNYILICYYYYYCLLEWERQPSGRETRKGGRGWEKDLVKDIGVWQSPARQPSYCRAVSGLSIEAIQANSAIAPLSNLATVQTAP